MEEDAGIPEHEATIIRRSRRGLSKASQKSPETLVETCTKKRFLELVLETAFWNRILKRLHDPLPETAIAKFASLRGLSECPDADGPAFER